jgi:uncharacterized protein YdeI (YjbR/CyaY-like superfamily)
MGVKKKALKAPAAELPVMAFAAPRAWSAWLKAHQASSKGVWLKLFKKGSGVASVSYAEALEEALVWGWIDGQRKAHDEAAFLQKFTPRGPRSLWSKINRERVLALIEAGKMQPPGLAAVERAKRDGRWEAAYDSPSRAVAPEDFLAALGKSPQAQAFFETLNAANRYALFFRLQTVKKAETRARRIALFVEMLAKREKFHP